ncbi:putative vacuolar membrane protein [Cutaneotrichosporon oleaginosum]|uniref:Putative vacuolar membrane protein n=1 Tax=Cutaneotrichosporon oleaginosum TaxID=879819 RepID=A0A0J0XSR5_9TREE|nr:putative vacuolar membrane protein [Cutaneotrichosporon oleaginosum]KLT44146.1 putative vacuolar membrane protein [Cutaneotrichosporon oleaginosum]TXT09399.1 hypothetical protein COLE_03333 [Cutaneotrichosporon oleaginosum]
MHAATALTAAWAALHTFQYGFAIAAMNGIQDVMVCPADPAPPLSSGLAPCVHMRRAELGLVVAVFTVGGLVGSLSSRAATAQRGQRGTLRLSALAILLGSGALALANSVSVMVIARIIVGLGCGLATTTVPIVLTDLAPRGKALGIANQLFIVFGILVAQALSFPFGGPGVWRLVPASAAGIAILQLAGSCLVHLPRDSAATGENEPLLDAEILTIHELFSSRDPQVKRGLPLILATQFFQQATGPSVVMYFSTTILSAVLPTSAKLIALAIVILKVPITLSPAFLMERVSTRRLLVLPTCIMVGAMFALAAGLNSGRGGLAVGGMAVFVTAFSVGLGPITWVVLGEVMPPRARPAASAVGLAVNWTTNFIVGSAFLPLQVMMGQHGHPGNIFYLFAGSCAAAVVAIRQGYVVYEASQ